MNKRLLTAALGVALASLATTASARPSEGTRLASYSHRYNSYDDGSLFYQRYFDNNREAGTERRRSRRSAHRSTRHRHSGHRVASLSRRERVSRYDRDSAWESRRERRASRRVRGSATTSRNCLTPPARALLGRIEAKFGTVQIVSTCRPGAVIAGTHHPSRHASGNAIDFNAPRGRKGEIVRWLIATHKNGGTMTYAHMNHIHVDIGYHFVSLNARR
jgi:uncharacterized protein YcbK (DUF882 family)